MSLLKIPMLVSAYYAYYTVTTSPTARPRKNERSRAPPGTNTNIMSRMWPSQVMCFHISLFLIFTCEILSILATRYPNLPYATSIASALTPTLSHNNIPLTPPSPPIDSSSYSPSVSTSIRASTPFILGWLLVVGGTIRIICYRTLGRHFTFELAVRDQHRLVTSFPYSLVRHPAYIGTFCGFVGMAICLVSPGSWVAEQGWFNHGQSAGVWIARMYALTFVVWEVAVYAWLMKRMESEEKMLKKEFGKEWEEWASRVKWKMIPSVF
ncbi:uncharacterized protein STEHIDRAFT_158832 [Stereum hirsutum FP-91666 SS1]|uniref:uncharacterized protein n=1 Tax=Stereum hirsutum (strain FP-91666) TaxID=721885 RepID=UPI000444A2B9|nr:uncharacterized protein STEHIDRAFT_158832 [Stereum hirsutum FP-91666 SS1]EIM85140.1 hypothetical protein STEHIDRAFT_158832 [Stereum hirsutum FP-91666 SS1]